jgi:hypothetical protein
MPPGIDPSPSEVAAVLVEPTYPTLRTWLRDRDLPFKPDYCLSDVAEMTSKGVRTVRNWVVRWNAPCHHWPSGEPYFTPQDIEDILTWGAWETKEGK